MRKIVLLVILIVVFAAFAGCLGGEAEKKKEKEPVLVTKTGKITPLSGWIQGENGEQASSTFAVTLNDTNVVSVKFSIKVDDSDAGHAESDEGSDPDDITVTASSGNNTDKKAGPTPFTATLEFKAAGGTETPQYLDSSWNIQIDAVLGGGKPRFIFGFLVWVDQGVSYTINADYTYMAIEETA